MLSDSRLDRPQQSGYGKDMSIYAVEHYTELEHVMIKH